MSSPTMPPHIPSAGESLSLSEVRDNIGRLWNEGLESLRNPLNQCSNRPLADYFERVYASLSARAVSGSARQLRPDGTAEEGDLIEFIQITADAFMCTASTEYARSFLNSERQIYGNSGATRSVRGVESSRGALLSVAATYAQNHETRGYDLRQITDRFNESFDADLKFVEKNYPRLYEFYFKSRADTLRANLDRQKKGYGGIALDTNRASYDPYVEFVRLMAVAQYASHSNPFAHELIRQTIARNRQSIDEMKPELEKLRRDLKQLFGRIPTREELGDGFARTAVWNQLAVNKALSFYSRVDEINGLSRSIPELQQELNS